MPLPSSGIIVVEKPSSASITRISNSSTSINTNSSIRPPKDQKEQQTQIQYYEYYDVHENQLSQQQQYQQQQQHSTIVVDATLFHHQQQKQQQHQLGGSSGVSIGRKIHSSSSTSSSSSSTSSASLCSTSSTLLNKSNLQIQTLKTVPMPQTKQYSQQQQIIQHTSHSTPTTATTSNPPHHIHQPTQHVQQINLAASSIHHQTQHHHSQQQQQTPSPNVIQVSEEFLEQAASNHNAGNMMISTTGEVINQQQIFKIVSTDGSTSNMIIDASNQSGNATSTNSKVLLSNLTVLSKQQASSQGQIIANNHQQSQTPGQTINFVNAKNLYTTSSAGGKQQKFTVANANVVNYKGSTIKQNSSANNQYLHQPNSLGQQKINMTAGNRNMQMLTTTRVQNASNSNASSNATSNSSIALISNNAAPAQTMVLQQPQKFITNNTPGSKMTTATLGSGGGNVIKKSTAGTLRMNNNHNTAAATKLMNNIQSTQGVKTFITQNSSVQPQTQQNINQLTLQHHAAKTGSKSKFVKQYNNAILNSAGTVAIATLPHQQSNSQSNLQIQQHHQLQQQTTYVSHHKSSGGSTKINKISAKYAQSTNMAAHLPAGTQLHQKSISQSQQQQFQTPNCNSNIKFVNAQGTVIQQQHQPQQQQQSLTQKTNSKHHHQHQQQYQNLQNFDTVDGNHIYNQANANQLTAGMASSTALPIATATGSSLLTDDIMMVNGTQMTDELSARILQSMSQKSFSNQRYQQQQQHVFQTKTSTTSASSSINSNTNNNNSNYSSNNNNMLPPPSCSTQNTIVQANNSNILLSPREYTLYPTTSSASTVGIMSGNQQAHHQLHQSSPIHYNSSATPNASTTPNITSGSFSSNNYIISNNSNSMTTITPHSSGISAASVLCSNTSNGSTSTVRQVQSAPSSRSQSMERKLHESSMSRKSTEYYKVKIKDYHTGCAFVVPSTATIYATNTSPSVTSLIDFIIPLPSCTTITTTNNITTSTNCATMTAIITNSSYNQNLTQQINNNSNHSSLRGGSHHSNLTATASVAQMSGSLGMTTGNISAVSNLMGSVVPTTSTISSPSPISRPSSLPPAPIILEPQAQVIHLQATKTLPGANNSSNDDDNDIIGEEIRPAPVETEDIRLRILHAVLLDHTYVNAMPLELPTSFAVSLPPTSIASSFAAPAGSTTGIASGQQWSLGGIGAISTAGPGVVAQHNYNVYGTQLSRLHEENESYSTFSNNSGLSIGDIDPGEETETAPEAELEDDSVTRCICDLTHDDGYMICCDKCCAWQHVDCMGIDRQNIPDEYLCELCQPRIVDKARARSLQLMKRKEQQQHLMLTAQAQSSSSVSTMAAAGPASAGSMGSVSNLLSNDILGTQQRLTSSSGTVFSLTGNMTADSSALQLLTAGGSNLKKSKILKKTKDSLSGKRSKKAEKLAAAAAAGLTGSGKPLRKETKKNTKRKKASTHDGSCSTVGMTAAEKHAANLRQWIENYELAVTNHYSPELRARLHAISKQPSLLQCILNTENPILKEFSTGSLENRATTVPHAGGKILISNLNIAPHSPICELRGKYMLTTQYKTQNTSMNMNSPPPNNYHLASYKAHKTPGPFIFFYQLPSTEVTPSYQQLPQTTNTAILNPDGTYTTAVAAIPALQSPPTFLKGPEICVDTRTYGNEARFVRRSCRPNAEIQHLFEKGTIHLFIVALTDIRASTEITIRHEPHDLLAVDNKKSSSIVIQSTSTPCACGLTKDCIFGPPIPQLPPAAKSNAGRKSLAHGGALSGNTGNMTAKQRKANQQNLNRNRSISSSASGDSNMGVTSAAITVSMSLNSPNTVNRMAATNKMIANSNILMPLSASCNSNLSNASSASSNLTSVMHDSGVCTSSSSPSVSIPSPTPNMHSPIQQQQQGNQQQHPHQFLHNTQMRSSVQLLPQQLLQSLPSPVVSTSPNVANQQQQQQNQQKQISVLQQPSMIISQQQQQSLTVIAQASTEVNSAQDVDDSSEKHQPQTSLCLKTQAAVEEPSHTHTQQQTLHQQLVIHEQQQQIETPQPTKNSAPSAATVSPEILETISPEATIAAVALQSLNASHSPNSSIAATSTDCPIVDPQNQLQTPPIEQQQFLIVKTNEVIADQLQQPKVQQSQTLEKNIPNTSITSVNSSPHQLQQQSPLQQHKSPQKANQSQNNSPHPVRKTPGKHGRTTSFSEDNEHQHNDDNSVTSTPTYSSTPKEKPKLSREDRKMEAILRAIEKMERNQQKQKQSKRQNAGSQNTTPTSPSKTFDSNENSGVSKRGNSNTGAAGRTKKKRKAGAKGGQSGGYNHRKRRQSRTNSQESVEDCSQQDHDTITSESDGGAAMHSPPIQTTAALRHPNFSTPTPSSAVGGIVTTPKMTTETSNNVDQAAGLLMAFANPISSSANEINDQHVPQSPHRSSSQYICSIDAPESSPPTPPSQVSSACLLIEAAVGPLESNLDGNNEEIHNAEFKYPLQAKTKKHLMNNWLHQAEDSSSDNNASTLSEQTSQTLQAAPAISVDCGASAVAGVSVVSSGGLDSLLQAAMSDLKQSQNNTEQPQNLSIAAQKVEEFIQQTEASACSPQIHPQSKHSYEYTQHQQTETTYINLPTPAVDLTLKTPLTIGPDPSTEVNSSNNRNFHLPLQVSTCSNNSSVKKRWLRQAISEETHEEFQHMYSMTPSPTKAVSINTFVNSQVQPIATCSSATVTNYVPNGFSTPLKKRRLLLTGKDDVDENIANSCADLFANSNQQPSTDLPQQHTSEKNETILQVIENKEIPQDLLYGDAHEDVDVDVEKCEINEKQLNCTQSVEHPVQQDQHETDVNVTISPQKDSELSKDENTEIVVKRENNVGCDEVKQEYLPSAQRTEQTMPIEFTDQEDDVDILRSPSPGREMIKAEDNLVKIEPEDISGMEDVKIDVEREESMAADDDFVTQHKEKKEDQITDLYKKDNENKTTSFSNKVEIKKEFKIESSIEAGAKQMENFNVESVKPKSENNEDLQMKSEEESQEPKSKRIKLEKNDDESKVEHATEKAFSDEDMSVKPEMYKNTKIYRKQENVPNSTTKEEETFLQTDSARRAKNLTSNAITKSTSSNLLNTDSTFDEIETATLPTTLTTTLQGGTAAPIQRQKSLSDDDIQARLHSFHKENILFLQSRNKKTKSSSSLTSNVNSNASSINCFSNNKMRTSSSSSSSSNHQHHHNHHHHYNYHDNKEKLDKYALKHRKNSSSTLSGSHKKQKLHKRERITSSSGSNSNKFSNPQIPPSSSLLNKNVTSHSNSTSSGSSKKIKSLKKSSSGSSNSSNTSLNTYSSSTSTIQNCYSISSLTTATSSNSEKERTVDKDKNHRQRTTSTSSNSVSGSNLCTTPTASFPSIKKRQLNFELELTKDMHLLNSGISGSSKHKREISRMLSDEQTNAPVKKSRKESTLSLKDDSKNGTNKHIKVEKQEKKNSLSVGGSTFKQSAGFYTLASSQSTTTPATNKTSITTPISTPTEEPKLIPTIVSQPPLSALTPIPILKEHPTIPHFNNVIVGESTNSLVNNQQQLQPNLTPVQSQPHTTVLSQNIPNHLNSPSFVQSVHSNHNPQQQQPPLSSTSPIAACMTPPLSAQNVNLTSHLPFYNTIYGKLLDNNTPPPSLQTPLVPSNTTTPSSPITTTVVQTGGGGVLLEYLDTKLKSYNTLGGYVSHTALFGLNNAPIVKDSPTSTAVVSSSIAIGSAGAYVKDSGTEMPAPHVPPSTVCSSSTTTLASTNSAANLTSMKIHTKTASHDPRLNPQLTAPEPPPQPKRKLSINEYRKRMQQTSSNDSNSGSGSLTTTPTTPPTSLDPSSFSSLLGPITPLTNKCTLNSPDRLTQSVDSQIQKEIMSTNSATTSSSSLDSLNSSNSSTSLNDTLLKSSSFVEEDSTKGQFNAAPTLLEKQQESLCARLKSLKEKQSLGTSFSAGSGDRSRFSSFSESAASGDCLRKDDEEMEIIRNRNLSISSSIGGGDLLDNCLEEISSTSTSMSSSREPSPERCYTSSHHKILTASATTTTANTSTSSHSNNGQTTTRHHQQHHHHQHNINCDKKSELTGLDCKRSVDIS